jgi:hypothetical protein
MYALIKENGVASPVEVLISVGVLSKEKYEEWRFGKIPYLEKVCQANLNKLSTINHEIRVFARKNDLKPSWTFYKKWGNNKKGNRGNAVKLRFSKSGDENIEQQYATHYVSQRKTAEAKERRETREINEKSIKTDITDE